LRQLARPLKAGAWSGSNGRGNEHDWIVTCSFSWPFEPDQAALRAGELIEW